MQEKAGFLLIDKPTDWTSHDVVAYLRGVTGVKKIGHAGTLDPFATGLLIVAVRRAATKRIDEFKNMSKTYIATITFGATSDTQDITGTITPSNMSNTVTANQLKETLAKYIGKQQQIPPMYSAKKVQGKKLYELARAGKVIERDPVTIEIFDIELLDISPTETNIKSCTIRVHCSPGTYIRTLCHDIGTTLGTGGYCSSLRRTHIGDYSVDQAMNVKEVTKENWHQILLSCE